ncbi:D123-domain-containing protein [Pisolithus orientalis]|uniref:D123-domain-containing protein n=1 Tax=Pisolithus orientalis TaxID=936130 RepID=UPI002223F8E4|nr:D123-domain-containing protein [Pisolithus orientalis]KAI6003538.1 D123-domain-containing protein [Pisolithus orientalis]
MSVVNNDDIFPPLTPDYILAFQFSNWYPSFIRASPKSTIIRPLGKDFKHYLESDSIFVPDGSEDVVVESTISDDDDDDKYEDTAIAGGHFSFPELDERIRTLRGCCRRLLRSNVHSPVDVYLLLKSSDFIAHDLSIESVFDGCKIDDLPDYELELVLRKWYPVDHSRISQRDTNFYDFMINPEVQTTIKTTVYNLWQEIFRPNWTFSRKDYIFDFLLTRDLSSGHIIDFNPYAPRTDPLLFTYEELHEVLSRENQGASASRTFLPDLRVIDSSLHPAATRNMPAYQHNRMPIEALTLSEDRNIVEFGEIWQEEVIRAMREKDD